VRALLDDQPVDIDATEAALGYRLRQHHVGTVAWVTGDVEGADGLTRLQRVVTRAARSLGNHGGALFVPRDTALAWSWLPLGNEASVDADTLAAAFDNGDASVRVAVGGPEQGLDGFRQTHRQAVRTQDLALAARPGTRVTTFSEVGAVALLAADITAARSWIWGTLGDLALDDDQHARMRETLRVFLSTGSYIATAERMMLHKNSVQYRIRKAEEALGSPIEDRRADLELALRACSHLGETVLRPLPQS
jgi:DNA-binding PucR family transcriptional regulator